MDLQVIPVINLLLKLLLHGSKMLSQSEDKYFIRQVRKRGIYTGIYIYMNINSNSKVTLRSFKKFPAAHGNGGEHPSETPLSPYSLLQVKVAAAAAAGPAEKILVWESRRSWQVSSTSFCHGGSVLLSSRCLAFPAPGPSSFIFLGHLQLLLYCLN